MTADSRGSPAAKAMDEAIDLAIEDRSPYPERAAFIDADAPSAGHDGSTRVLKPEFQTR